MYMYKLEILVQTISIHDKMTDTTRVVPEYVISDDYGLLHATCPRGWSEQQVAQVVDRLNAEARVASSLVGPVCDVNTESSPG